MRKQVLNQLSRAIIAVLILYGHRFAVAGATQTVDIDRYPPVTGGGTAGVISSEGVKPNVFLILDNSGSMTDSVSSATELFVNNKELQSDVGYHNTHVKFNSGSANRMQVVAAGILNSFQQLEGKIRLAYATINRPYFDLSVTLCFDQARRNCQINDRSTLASILQYPALDDAWKDSFGMQDQLVPRTFVGDYAKNFYKWVAYLQPAGATNLERSYQKILKAVAQNDGGEGERVMPSPRKLDFFADAVSDKSDPNFGWPVKENGGSNVRSCRANFAIVVTDGAYNGVQLSHGYAIEQPPGEGTMFRGETVGLGSYFSERSIGLSQPKFEGPQSAVGVHFSQQTHALPENLHVKGGKIYTNYDPSDMNYAYIYRDDFSPIFEGNDGKLYLSTSLSDMAFFGWIADLRPDLKNDVAPYWHDVDANGNPVPRKQGLYNAEIPPVWDRKNDPATWQHLVVYALGLTDGVPSWARLRTMFNPFYPELNKAYDKRGKFSRNDKFYSQDTFRYYVEKFDSEIENSIEGYFRAVEDGTIYSFSRYMAQSKSTVRQNNKSVRLYTGKPVYNLLESALYQDHRLFQDDRSPDPQICQAARGTAGDIRHCFGGAYGYVFNKMGILSDAEAGQYYKDPELDFFWRWKSNRDSVDAVELDYAKMALVSRGEALSVTDPTSLERVIKRIAKRIDSAYEATKPLKSKVSGTVSSRAITSTQKSNSMMYVASVDAKELGGDVHAFALCAKQDDSACQNKIDPKDASKSVLGNTVSTVAKWNLSERLFHKLVSNQYQGYKDIPIFTIGEHGKKVDFQWDNLSQQEKMFVADGDGDAVGKDRIDYIRGRFVRSSDKVVGDVDASVDKKITLDPALFRPRGKASSGVLSMVGEIIYSTPTLVDHHGSLGNLNPLRQTAKYQQFLEDSVQGRYDVSSGQYSGARDPLVILGSNDGKVYVLNGDTGDVVFQYVPLGSYSKLAATTRPEFLGDTLVAGKFAAKDVQFSDGSWHTLVVGSMGAGGKSIFAFDVNKQNLEALDKNKLILWEKTDRELPETLGNITAAPRIVWLANKSTSDNTDGRWVVLMPNGYNSKSNSASLIVLDAETGSVLAEIDTKSAPSDGAPNGLSALTVVDTDQDGGADAVYAGDLQGNVWKFRIGYDSFGMFYSNDVSFDKYNAARNAYEQALATTAADVAQKKKAMLDAYQKIKPATPLFVAQDDSGSRQPITAAIAVADSSDSEGNMLYFGTGELFSVKHADESKEQSFYAVLDNYTILDYMMTHSSHSPIISLPLTRSNLFAKEFYVLTSTANTAGDSAIRAARQQWLDNFGEIRGIRDKGNLNTGPDSNFSVTQTERQPRGHLPEKFGWYIDFPKESYANYDQDGREINHDGGYRERVINKPLILDNQLYFISFSPRQGVRVKKEVGCDAAAADVVGGGAGVTRFYMLNRFDGNYLQKAPFDLNGDGVSNDADAVTVDSKGTLRNSAGVQLTGGYGALSDAVSTLVKMGKNYSDHQNANYRSSANICETERQVIFPTATDSKGNILVLKGCYENHFRTWKQVQQED